MKCSMCGRVFPTDADTYAVRRKPDAVRMENEESWKICSPDCLLRLASRQFMPEFVHRVGRHYVTVHPTPRRPTYYCTCTCGWESAQRIEKEDARQLGRKHATRGYNEDLRAEKNKDAYSDGTDEQP